MYIVFQDIRGGEIGGMWSEGTNYQLQDKKLVGI